MLDGMSDRDFSSKPATLRARILAFVGALVLLSILGSTISLYRITEVNQLLDTINRVSVPLGKLFTQMQSDADVYGRELERGLGHTHWDDPHWRPRPTPQWIEDVLEGEVTRVSEMIRNESSWAQPDERAHFAEWAAGIAQGLQQLRMDAARLYTALSSHDAAQSQGLYPRWNSEMEEWRRQVQLGSAEYERSLRQTFRLAESRAAELRTGLELVLIVVVLLSLLVLWLGERALRPLAELTGLARDIARRGLRKGDKALLPEIPITRDDEVSQLAREFHRMATALLEREITVEAQKHRLIENNRLLKDMGELNENILLSIESVLIVTDLAGRITQVNPLAASWLHGEIDEQSELEGRKERTDRILGTLITSWPKLKEFFRKALLLVGWRAEGSSPGARPDPIGFTAAISCRFANVTARATPAPRQTARSSCSRTSLRILICKIGSGARKTWQRSAACRPKWPTRSAIRCTPSDSRLKWRPIWRRSRVISSSGRRCSRS